jgi:hypothetical protein
MFQWWGIWDEGAKGFGQMKASDWPHQPGDEDSIWEEELGIVTCANCGCKFETSKELTNIKGASYVCSEGCLDDLENKEVLDK